MHVILKENPQGVIYLRDELDGWIAQLDQRGRERGGAVPVRTPLTEAIADGFLPQGHRPVCARVDTFPSPSIAILKKLLNRSKTYLAIGMHWGFDMLRTAPVVRLIDSPPQSGLARRMQSIFSAAWRGAPGLRGLLMKGGLAVTDQALFSGANFLVSVLLARRLPAADYGAFSLANSAFLLIAALHQALLLEPMMIFGAGRHRDRLPRYFRLLAAFHAVILVPASLAMWLIAVLLGHFYSPATQSAFEGAALCLGLLLLFWLVRRIFYVLLKPAWSVIGSFLYFVFVAGAVAILWWKQTLTPWTAFVAMGLASLLASAAVLARFVSSESDAVSPLTFREVVADHWGYGRWAIGSALMSWFPSNIYYVLLAAWLGLEGVGALRAVTNFVMPVLQAITAVNLLMIPSLVRDLRSGGIVKMERGMVLFLKLYGGGCVLYLFGLWILRNHIFQIVYAGRYDRYMGWPLLLAGALPLVASVYSVIGNGLRALERPDRMLWAFFGSSGAAVVFGIPLTAKFGITGALLGNHFSAAIFIVALWQAYKSVSRAYVRAYADSTSEIEGSCKTLHEFKAG